MNGGYTVESISIEQQGWRRTCMRIAYPVERLIQTPAVIDACYWLMEKRVAVPRWIRRLVIGDGEVWQAAFFRGHVTLTTRRDWRNINATAVVIDPKGVPIIYESKGISVKAGVPFAIPLMKES